MLCFRKVRFDRGLDLSPEKSDSVVDRQDHRQIPGYPGTTESSQRRLQNVLATTTRNEAPRRMTIYDSLSRRHYSIDIDTEVSILP